MADRLDLAVLGGLNIRRNGAPVLGFVSAKAQALLGYLAVTPRPHTRAALAGLLWSELPEAEARKNLRDILFNLRHLLPDHLLITRDTVAFNTTVPYSLDVEVFERYLSAETAASGQTIDRAREALALYQGDFMAGFYVRDAPLFEEWVLGQRERLRQMALHALHTLAAYHTTRAEYTAGIDYLTRLLQLEPWREDARRQLMLLLAWSGQRDAALAQYETCQRMLADEMGVAPADETTDLYDQIRLGRVEPRLALARPRHNLPAPPTRLVGREADLAQLTTLLAQPDTRLVSLIGPGGMGKTRLALALAHRYVDATTLATTDPFPDGVFFVSLAALSEPGQVSETIANTLDIREQVGQPVWARLVDELRNRRLLLVLDNFEPVLAAAPHIADLVAGCPWLKIIVTSRAVLHLRGEHEFVVQPLDLPTETASSSWSDLAAAAAMQLFVQRAQDTRPDFVLTADNAPLIAAICRRLDGLPLAIELAAARLKALPPHALLQRLDQRLPLLTGGARDMPLRHQTLRAAIAGSYDLLDATEKTLFEQLAVFVGGFSLTAVETVVGDADLGVLDSLQALLDKSLLRLEPAGRVVTDAPRYRMLETIREYALERLVASGQAEVMRARHAAAYLAQAEATEPHLWGPDQAHWLEHLDRDQDNFRAALDWATHTGAGETALRLAGAMGWFWYLRGTLREGRGWLEAALDATRNLDQPTWRGKALNAVAALAVAQSDYTAAREFYTAILALRRAMGDERGVAGAHGHLGLVAYYQGDYAQARACLELSVAMLRDLGDQPTLTYFLNNLGLVASDQGDYAEATRLFEEGLVINRALGHQQPIAYFLNNLGDVARQQGDFIRAARLVEESLTLNQSLKHKSGMAYALNTLGLIAYGQGDLERALALCEESLALRRALDDRYGMALALGSLGRVAVAQGDTPLAATLFADSLAIWRTLGQPRGLAEALEGLASVEAEVGRLPQAARLLAAADHLRQTIGAPLPLVERTEYAARLEEIRSGLGQHQFQWLWAVGQGETLDETLAHMREYRRSIDVEPIQ